MKTTSPFSIKPLPFYSACLALHFLFCFENLEAARCYGALQVDKVCRVHDGDTFIVDIFDVHPLIGEKISIRIAKIDTPEITDKREKIKKMAIEARDYVADRLNHANIIELTNMQRDKYFRILADVYIDGIDLAEELISKGLAKPYDGAKKPVWE
ncbi:MAG: thermonuclease family protein [Parachlamydiaceae bacterium]